MFDQNDSKASRRRAFSKFVLAGAFALACTAAGDARGRGADNAPGDVRGRGRGAADPAGHR